MNAALSDLALWALVMAAVTLAFWGLSHLLLRRYSAGTLSALWLLVALAWQFPVRPAVPWGARATALGSNPQQRSGELVAGLPMVDLAVGIAIVGTVIAVIRLGLQQRRFLAHVRRWGKEVKDPQLLASVRRSAHDLGLKRFPVLLEVPGIHTPMVFGARHPKLLIPTQGLAPDELVVRHELAHIKRHDPQIRLLLGMFQALQWWNPFVHLAAKNLRASSEIACDQAALRGVPQEQRHAYARSLLHAATATNPNVLVVAFGERGAYRSRLGAIMDSSGRKGGALLAFPFLLAFGLVGVPVALQPSSVLPGDAAAPITSSLPTSSSQFEDVWGVVPQTTGGDVSAEDASELDTGSLVESGITGVTSGDGAGAGSSHGSGKGVHSASRVGHSASGTQNLESQERKGWGSGNGSAAGRDSASPLHSPH